AQALEAEGASVTWIEGPGDADYLAGVPAEKRFALDQQNLQPLLRNLSEADLLICNDTSYVHIAAGFGVPTVAVFGAGQDARFHPAGGRVKVVHGQIACAG